MLYIIVACIGTFVTFLIYLTISSYKHRKNLRLPPGPSGLPILGNLEILSPLKVLNHKEKYGHISYVNILGNGIAYFHSLEAIQEAYLHSDGVFDDRPKTFFKQYIVQRSLILSSLKEPFWWKQRTLMIKTLRKYERSITGVDEIVREELQYAGNIMEQTNGELFDIEDVLKPSTCNMLFIPIIGQRFDYDHTLIRVTRESIDLQNTFAKPAIDVFLRTFPFVRFLPCDLGRTYYRIMHLRNQQMDYLFHQQKLLDTGEQIGISFDLIREQRRCDWLEDSNVLGALDDIFTAGYLTTALSMCSLVLILLHNPDIQARIQAEIDDIIGTASPVVTDKTRMPYTWAVLLEHSRYVTVVPFPFPRICDKDTTVFGYSIPKDTVVIVNMFRANHDPDHWENPWMFDPNRFLDQEGNLLPPQHPNRKNILTFGLGTRACIGEGFAKTRMFLYLTHFLQRFTFLPGPDLPSCDPRDYVPDLTIHPPPFKLRVVAR